MSTYADPTIVSISQNPKIQPGAVLVLLAGILALLVAGFFYGETIFLKNNTETTNRQIQKNKQRIEQLSQVADELNSYNSLAHSLHTLFDGQQHWEQVLGSLQQRLYKKMKITSFQAKDSGVIQMTATTTDFTQYANILTSLTDAEASKYFSSVKPISVTKVNKGTSSEIDFSFELTISPAELTRIKNPVQVTP